MMSPDGGVGRLINGEPHWKVGVRRWVPLAILSGFGRR